MLVRYNCYIWVLLLYLNVTAEICLINVSFKKKRTQPDLLYVGLLLVICRLKCEGSVVDIILPLMRKCSENNNLLSLAVCHRIIYHYYHHHYLLYLSVRSDCYGYQYVITFYTVHFRVRQLKLFFHM